MNDHYGPERRAHRHIKPAPFDVINQTTNVPYALMDALIVVVGLLCFLVLLSWMQQKDLDDAVSYQKDAAARYAKMLATCMNGGAVVDRVTNTAHFCGKTIAVSLN